MYIVIKYKNKLKIFLYKQKLLSAATPKSRD